MTVDEALRHPYVKKFVNEAEETVLTEMITIPMDENTKFTIKDYREMLYLEIMKKKKESRK
jgi:mitogen-activated protein kinase 15